MLQALSNGNVQAAANNLSGARVTLREAQALQLQNGLDIDADVNATLDQLRKRIFSKECENAQRSMDSLASASRQSMELGDYILADEQMEQAIRLAADNKDCALNDQAFKAVRDSIRPVVVFGRELRNVNALQSNGRYAEATEAYLKLDRETDGAMLSRYKVELPAFLDFRPTVWQRRLVDTPDRSFHQPAGSELSADGRPGIVDPSCTSRQFQATTDPAGTCTGFSRPAAGRQW